MRPTCGSTRHLTEGQLCSTLPFTAILLTLPWGQVTPLTPSPPSSAAAAVAGSVFLQLRPTNRPLSVRLCLCPDRCLCLLFFRVGVGSWAPVTPPPPTHTPTPPPSPPHHPHLPRPLCATVTGLARGSGGDGGRLSTTDPPQNDSSDQRLTAAEVTQSDPEVNQLITHPRVLRLCHHLEGFFFFSFFFDFQG